MKALLVIICLLQYSFLQALSPFQINVHVDSIPADSVAIKAVYKAGNLVFDQSSIVIGSTKNHFSGTIGHPHGVIIELYSGSKTFKSRLIIIESGLQTIVIEQKQGRTLTCTSSSRTDSLYYASAQKYYAADNQMYALELEESGLKDIKDSLIREHLLAETNQKWRELYAKRDSSTAEMAINTPGSYGSLWHLLYQSIFHPNKAFVYSCFSKLHFSLKDNGSAINYAQAYSNSNTLTIGTKFPFGSFEHLSGIPFSFTKHAFQYVLVEFWFYSCGPCRKQFELWKRKETLFENLKIRTVAIAVDAQPDKETLMGIIIRNGYSWTNLWDKDAQFATRYMINAYPTSFLLDKQGVIVGVNPTIDEVIEIAEAK